MVVQATWPRGIMPLMSRKDAGTKSESAEIEVTLEMVEAGLIEFADRDRWDESDEAVIARIYRAMELVRRLGWRAFWSRDAKRATTRKSRR